MGNSNVDRELRSQLNNTLARYVGKMNTHQLRTEVAQNIFEVVDKQRRQCDDAYNAGYAAGVTGPSNCPYPPDSGKADMWYIGYCEAAKRHGWV